MITRIIFVQAFFVGCEDDHHDFTNNIWPTGRDLNPEHLRYKEGALLNRAGRLYIVDKFIFLRQLLYNLCHNEFV